MTTFADKFLSYPERPGFKAKETETSRQAAHSIASKSKSLQDQCYSALKGAPLTADEVAELVGKSILSIRPRLSELLALYKIEDSGLRRKNISGKSAVVWRAIKPLTFTQQSLL